MSNKVSPQSPQAGIPDGSDYHGFLGRLQAGFEEQVAHQQLFTTDAAGLWEAYLAAIPEETRQSNNCGSCRRFVERFGHLVTLDETGNQRSPFWNEHLAISENFAAVQRGVLAQPQAGDSRG
jgi:hypothetical protein